MTVLFALLLVATRQDARQHYDTAKAKYLQGDLDGAIRECTRAIEIDPRYAEAYKRNESYQCPVASIGA